MSDDDRDIDIESDVSVFLIAWFCFLKYSLVFILTFWKTDEGIYILYFNVTFRMKTIQIQKQVGILVAGRSIFRRYTTILY